MKINIAADIKVGDRRVAKVILNGKIVWERNTIDPAAPSFNLLEAATSATNTFLLTYEILENLSPITKIEYRVNDNLWIDAGTTNPSGSITLAAVPTNSLYKIEVRATNGIGTTVSESLFAQLEGVTSILFQEGFGARDVDAWRDDNSNNPIAGEPIVVKVKPGIVTNNKDVQIKYLAFDSSGNYPGTHRIEHPYAHFGIAPQRCAEMSVDWYFEDIWDFNTIGQNAAELKQRLMDYDGLSEAAADAQVASWDPNANYADTGFPYNVGKMHGLISNVEGSSPAGGNPPEADEWSVRCVWVKDVHSHPDYDGSVFTDGVDPTVGPTLALYIYDQDRVAGEFGRYVYMPNFELVKQTWYTIKILVQINEPGQNDGLAWLRVYNRTDGSLLGSAFIDNLQLHANDGNDNHYIHKLFFSTFFGGGDMRWSPKMDAAWDSIVDVNNGVYARNDNYQVRALPYLEKPSVSLESYLVGDEFIFSVDPGIPLSLVDIVEYNFTADGDDYDSGGWQDAGPHVISDGKLLVNVDGLTEGGSVRFRYLFQGQPSARSLPYDVQSVATGAVPLIASITEGNQLLNVFWKYVPTPPTLDSVDVLNGGLDLNFSAPEHTGNDPITEYQLSVNGGAWQSIGLPSSPYRFTGDNGTEYSLRLRAKNSVGVSRASAAVAGTPSASVTSWLFAGEVWDDGGTWVDSEVWPAVLAAPSIDDFTLNLVEATALTFGYRIDDNEYAVSAIEYELDGSGSWVDIGKTDLISSFKISGLTEGQEYSVRVRAVNANGTAQSTSILATPVTQVLPPPSAISPKFNGFWDSQNKFFGNVAKGFSVSQALSLYQQHGVKVIPSGMPFTPVSSGGSAGAWQTALENAKGNLHTIGSANTHFVLLVDEPLGKGWTGSELEQLVELARSVLNTDGEQFRFGYTFTRGQAMGWQGPYDFPQNNDYAGLNFYPGVPQTPYYSTETGFKAHFDDCMNGMRQRCNTDYTRFFVTGQAFYGAVGIGNGGQGWIEPGLNFPYWCAEKVQAEADIDGLLYYEWQTRRPGTPGEQPGCNEMPQYYANILDAHEQSF